MNSITTLPFLSFSFFFLFLLLNLLSTSNSRVNFLDPKFYSYYWGFILGNLNSFFFIQNGPW